MEKASLNVSLKLIMTTEGMIHSHTKGDSFLSTEHKFLLEWLKIIHLK